jgi:hypothetical protein
MKSGANSEQFLMKPLLVNEAHELLIGGDTGLGQVLQDPLHPVPVLQVAQCQFPRYKQMCEYLAYVQQPYQF